MKLNEWQMGLLIFFVSVLVLYRLLRDYANHKGFGSITSYLKSINKKADPLKSIIEYIYLNQKPNTSEYEKYNFIYYILEYESEVNNGGHHQYFWNSSGNNYKKLIRALEQIGAKENIRNLKKIIEKFSDEIYINRIKRQEQMEKDKLESGTFDLEDNFIFMDEYLGGKYRQYILDNIDYFNRIISEK